MFSLPFTLERSTVIEKPIGEVFKTISDFSTWNNWSPWLCQEPDCPLERTGTPGEKGHSQSWNGTRIGSGSMELVSLSENESLDYDLRVAKPWKSKSKASFILAEENGGTRVAWTMQGSVPIFLFFMKKMMMTMIGCDYERGLVMLKELLETGTVVSSVEVGGIVSRDLFSYLGEQRACAIAEIGPGMAAVIDSLKDRQNAGTLPEPDFIFSFYNSFDMVNQRCEYITAFGYRVEPAVAIPPGLVQGSVIGHEALGITHSGPYRHLGNAWSAGMAEMRHRKLTSSKDTPMYEVYETVTGDSDEKDIRTAIYLPIG